MDVNTFSLLSSSLRCFLKYIWFNVLSLQDTSILEQIRAESDYKLTIKFSYIITIKMQMTLICQFQMNSFLLTLRIEYKEIQIWIQGTSMQTLIHFSWFIDI